MKCSREKCFALEQLTTIGDALSVSADGIDWQDIQLGLDIDPEFAIGPLDIDPEFAGEPPAVSVTVANNKIFVSIDHDDARTLWIGDVDHV